MRIFYLMLFFLLYFSWFAKSQTFWEENFDSYSAGEYVGIQSTDWSTWSGNGAGTNEDLMVTSELSNSGSNSLKCIGGVDADVLIPLNNLGEGEYTFELSLYIVPGNGGYYNIQEYNTPGIAWAFECYFSNDGSWQIIQDQVQVASGSFTPGIWFQMSHVIDLANNLISIYQNGAPVGNFTFDSALGSINIFPAAPPGQTALYYIDDIYVYKSKENFDDYLSNEFLGDHSQQWTTWSGSGNGTNEDGEISNLFAYNGTNSGKMEGIECDALYPMANFSAGSWELSLKLLTPFGSGAHFNLQHNEVPGMSWAHELNMGGNNGSINAGGTGAATFPWSDDEWHSITFIYDIENDDAQLWIDGSFIYNWAFSDEALTSGTGSPIIGALNFHPSAITDNLNPEYYIDNLTFRRTSLATSFDSIESQLNELILFPNPTNGELFIQNKIGVDLETEIRIYNSFGQLIEHKLAHIEIEELIEINSGSWNSGIYFIEILTYNSQHSLKFIKN